MSLSIAVVVMGLKMSKVFDSSFDGQYSIAVMPFVNMSDDVNQEYFSDGLSEELISQNVTFTWMNNLKKFEKDLKTSQSSLEEIFVRLVNAR